MENFSNTLISPGLESILKICQKIFQGAQPLAVVDHAQRKLLDHAVCNAKFIKNNNRYRTFEKMPDWEMMCS